VTKQYQPRMHLEKRITRSSLVLFYYYSFDFYVYYSLKCPQTYRLYLPQNYILFETTQTTKQTNKTKQKIGSESYRLLILLLLLHASWFVPAWIKIYMTMYEPFLCCWCWGFFFLMRGWNYFDEPSHQNP
jgi:hypothetical protein